jgi:hypothetical protein
LIYCFSILIIFAIAEVYVLQKQQKYKKYQFFSGNVTDIYDFVKFTQEIVFNFENIMKGEAKI